MVAIDAARSVNTYDAFDNREHYQANHMHERHHCTTMRMDIVELWPFRSNSANIGYKTWRAGTLHIANDNFLS